MREWHRNAWGWVGHSTENNLHSYCSSFELHSVNDENKKAGIRNVWGWIKEKKIQFMAK